MSWEFLPEAIPIGECAIRIAKHGKDARYPLFTLETDPRNTSAPIVMLTQHGEYTIKLRWSPNRRTATRTVDYWIGKQWMHSASVERKHTSLAAALADVPNVIMEALL